MCSVAGSPAVDQPICCFRPESRRAASPAAFVLSHKALRSPVLGLWVGQLASAPDVHPPEVSVLGAPPGFQVWAPGPLICMQGPGFM